MTITVEKEGLGSENASNKRPIKTWSRRSMISPDMMRLKLLAVHNVKQHVTCVCHRRIMVGHKSWVGVFAKTTYL